MDDFEQTKSCWGVTFYAVAAFAGFVAVSSAIFQDAPRQTAEIDPAAAVVAAN